MMTRSPSSWRTVASEASKNPRSKPSCTSIKRTANPIPALERTSRALLARRLRRASGTNRGSRERECVSAAVKTGLRSEDFGGVGPPQAAEREERGRRRHYEGDQEHRAKL